MGDCLIYRKGRATWTDHRWKPLDKVTTLYNGRRLSWHQCQSCGSIESRKEKP